MNISAATVKKFEDMMKGYVYSPKIDGYKLMIDEQQDFYGYPYTNPCAEHSVGGEVLQHNVTMKITVKPKAYPMPLANPKSAWGKRMAEKLAQKS